MFETTYEPLSIYPKQKKTALQKLLDGLYVLFTLCGICAAFAIMFFSWIGFSDLTFLTYNDIGLCRIQKAEKFDSANYNFGILFLVDYNYEPDNVITNIFSTQYERDQVFEVYATKDMVTSCFKTEFNETRFLKIQPPYNAVDWNDFLMDLLTLEIYSLVEILSLSGLYILTVHYLYRRRLVQ